MTSGDTAGATVHPGEPPLGARAVWDPPAEPLWAGLSLTATDDLGTPAVVIGAPGTPDSYGFGIRPFAALVTLPDLAEVGRYTATELVQQLDRFGDAGADRPGPGFAVAASRFFAHGKILGFDGPPVGDAPYEDTASFTIDGSCGPSPCYTGGGMLFADLSGEGLDQLVFTVSGEEFPEDAAGGLYVFDPPLPGAHTLDEARASVTGGGWYFGKVAEWDPTGDGEPDLLVAGRSEVWSFSGPWEGSRDFTDATAVWASSQEEVASVVGTLGDIDGDGFVDAAFGAADRSVEGVERTGALYVLRGGASIVGGPAEELPLQVVGTEVGEGVASAVEAGDFDGDGVVDLAVGAADLYPAWEPGDVRVYLGPLPTSATLTAADATLAVEGEEPNDFFGARLLAVDADGDAKQDLVVSALNHGGSGRVYLFLGADLFP